ncbi:MAG: hypothetical protein V2A73_13925, partial [Pseudomonadota bacterium]
TLGGGSQQAAAGNHTHAGTGSGNLLSSTVVTFGAVASTHLYTVPAGKKCLVIDIFIRGSSASLNQATDPIVKFGWSDADGDVKSSTTLALDLVGGYCRLLTYNAVQRLGAAGDILHANVTQACTDNPTTAIVEVTGYLIDA